jgi:hypothetical protein
MAEDTARSTAERPAGTLKAAREKLKSGAADQALALLEPLFADGGTQDAPKGLLMRAALAAGRPEAALDRLADLDPATLGPLDRLRLMALSATAGRPAPCDPPPPGEDRADALQRLARQAAQAPAPEALLPLLDSMAGEEDAAAARETYTAALLRRGIAARFAGQSDLAERCAGGVLASRPDPETRAGAMLLAGQLQVERADFDGAARTAETLEAGTSDAEAEAAAKLRRTLDRVRGGTELNPDEVYMEGSVGHFPTGGDTVLVWFLHAFSSADIAILRRVREVLAGHGVSLVTVSDARGFGGLTGWGPHLGDRASAEEELADIIAGLGYKRIVTAGNSMSASAAILFGVTAEAIGTLALAGFYRMPDPSSTPGRRNAQRAQRLFAGGGNMLTSIGEALAGRPDYILHYHYGTASRLDAVEAPGFLALPQTRPFPHDTDKHAIVKLFHDAGREEELYLPFLRDCGLV